MKEIAEQLGVNYYTIRQDIQNLITNGKVSPNGTLKGKAIMFIAGPRRPMPMIRNLYNGEQINPADMARGYINHVPMNSPRAAAAFPEFVIEILHRAYRARKGQTIDAKELTELRKAMTHAQLLLNSTANLYAQMLAAENLWSPKLLATLTEDPSFPDEIDNWYTEMLRRRQNESAK